MTDDFALLHALLDRARQAYRHRAIGCYVAAGAVVAITAALTGREFYEQGPMVLAGFLLIPAVLYHVWYARTSWDRNPVLRALRDRPEQIDRAVVEHATGREALLPERQVTITAGERWVMLTVANTDLGLLGELLRARVPQIELSGFDG